MGWGRRPRLRQEVWAAGFARSEDRRSRRLFWGRLALCAVLVGCIATISVQMREKPRDARALLTASEITEAERGALLATLRTGTSAEQRIAVMAMLRHKVQVPHEDLVRLLRADPATETLEWSPPEASVGEGSVGRAAIAGATFTARKALHAIFVQRVDLGVTFPVEAIEPFVRHPDEETRYWAARALLAHPEYDPPPEIAAVWGADVERIQRIVATDRSHR